MAATDTLEFNDISSEVKGSMCQGRLKLTDQSIVFKNSKTGKVEQYLVIDVDSVSWMHLVGMAGMRIFLKNGILHRFSGFRESEREKIAKFFKSNYRIDLLEKELSVKGWNWGTAKFAGCVLSFDVGNATSFEIPLNNVSQCTTGKNEVTLEFHQNDDAPVSLMEMRFHIPSSELAGAPDPVESFHEQVMKQASVISVSGDAIAIFREIHCLTPRGRYDIKIFQSFFQLHGKTFDYKVPMSTVIRLFILPHKDGRQHFLVISLDPPIKQGQTRYHYLVLLFNYDDDTTLELPLSEQELQTKYEGKMEKDMSGPTYEVLGKIMKVLVGRKITLPASFKGISGTPAISCSFKAAAGYIYPLDRGFIYIHKPPIHIRFEEISSVNFARGGGSTRSFDFEIELKNSVVHTFSSIEKGEYGKLFDFIKDKKLRVKNIGKTAEKVGQGDDFRDSDDEGPDAYLERVKREGEEKEEDDEDDEDDESTDEDFKPPEQESEVEDEYDSNHQSSDSDDGGSTSESKKHKKEKSEKKHKKKTKTVPERGPKKSKKKEKDVNKPKRPPSAYMLWFQEERKKITAENPKLSFAEVGKLGGERWKAVKDKSVWDEKANEAKAAYQKALKDYEKGEGGGSVSKGNLSPTRKKSQHKKSAPSSASKLGSGANYVSKEFIEDDSSTSSGSDSKLPSAKKAKAAEPTPSKKKTASASDPKKSSASSSSSDEEKENERKGIKSGKKEVKSDKSGSSSKRKKREGSSSEEKESDKRVKKKKVAGGSDNDEEDEDSTEASESEASEDTPASSDSD